MSWPHPSNDLRTRCHPCELCSDYVTLDCSFSTPRTTFCKQLCGRCGRQGPCRHAASQSKRKIKSIVMTVHDDPVWPFCRQFCRNLSKTIQFRNIYTGYLHSHCKWQQVSQFWGSCPSIGINSLLYACSHPNHCKSIKGNLFFWMFVQSFQAVPGPHTWISRFASTPVQGWSLLITGTHGFIMVLESCMEMGIGKIWRCLMFEAESSRDGNLPWSAFKQTSDTHFLKPKTKHFDNLG